MSSIWIELNIPNIVSKYIFLFAFDEYAEMKSGDEHKLTEDEILRHLEHCMKLKNSFNKSNKETAGIKLFGNNIRNHLIKSWNHLRKLIECDRCNYNPFIKRPLSLSFVELAKLM